MDIKAMIKWGKVAIIIFLINFLINLGVLGILLWLLLKPEKKTDQVDLHLSRAGLYSANGLFGSAAKEYQISAELADGEKAINLWIRAGDICYEKLEDYECATESYLNAKILGKEFAKDSEVAIRLVDSLKRLGKTESANALLSELTALVPSPNSGSTVAARIGERQITMKELRKALESEPELVRKNFSGKDGLRNYLDHYIFTKLLYQSALDENLVDDKSREEFERMKERYIAELYFQKKFLSQVKLTEKEIRDYYEQNSQEFKNSSGETKSFVDAKAEIEQKLKENKLGQIRDDWFKEQAQKRGLFINAQAFGSE